MLYSTQLNGRCTIATEENALLIIEQILPNLPPPKFSFDNMLQVRFVTKSLHLNKGVIFDFVSIYEEGWKNPLELNTSKYRYVLEYHKESWRMMSQEDFNYYTH